MCNSLFAHKRASVGWFSRRIFTVNIVQCFMHRSPNKHLSPLKYMRSETKFHANFLDQIAKAKTSPFNEICWEIHVEQHDKIKYVFLNKQSVSKELF